MTIDEAIKHCEEVAQENEKQFNSCPMKYDGAYANNGRTACKCAEEHRQLAKWLKELKAIREAWTELAETVIELRDNGGTCTQHDVCKFLATYMYNLEKEIMQKTEK